MPYIEDVTDISGYFHDALKPEELPEDGMPTIGFGIDKTITRILTPLERWPVLNREPRTPITSLKRALIHERDNGMCRYCKMPSDMLTVDHVIPRSAFPADMLDVADRSDNLVSACWPCNERKSNYEHGHGKRMGVVLHCWSCANPHAADESDATDIPATPVVVYCGRCHSMSNVPSIEGWIV